MRKFLAFAAVVALSALSAPLVAQNPAGGAPQAQRRVTQGGSGPIRMLLITKAHAYEREPYYQMFDSMGADITWMHVDHPAAEAFMTPKYASRYDVAFFFDMNGAQADLGRSKREPAPNNPFYPNGTRLVVNPPSAELQRGYPELLRMGKGMVFTHHSLASWPHSWPEYIEVMGGACDWGNSITTRGVQHPNSGFFPMTPQRITVVNKTHPITQGLGDSFDIIDESYSCPYYEDSVIPLLRTDFKPADHNRNLSPNWKYSNLAAWAKSAENSPVAYIQMGHGPAAWANESYRKLVLNAIKWAASPEALAWAKANPKRIFKTSTN